MSQESLLSFEKGQERVVETELLMPYDSNERESKLVIAKRMMELKAKPNFKKKTLEWAVNSYWRFFDLEKLISEIDDTRIFKSKEEAEKFIEWEKEWAEFSKKNYVYLGQKYHFTFEVVDGKFRFKHKAIIMSNDEIIEIKNKD